MRWTKIDNHFQLRVNMKPFGPSSIKVFITSQGDLIVRAGHDDMVEEDGHISRSFVGRIAIPMEMDSQSIESSVSADGVLSITAKQMAATYEKIIPVFPANPHGHLSDHPRVSPGGP